MTKKAIGQSDFELLSQEMQLDLLHRDGVFVGKRKLSEQTVVLFQLYSFYIEVHYKKYRKNIDHLNITSAIEVLQPYLDQINVRDLNKNRDKE